MTFGIMLAALVTASAAPQDATARIDTDLPAYWKGEEGWRVFSYPDEGMCDIGFPTASGEYVTVGFSPREHGANLLVTNKHATSLRTGETRTLAVGFGAAPGQRFNGIHMLHFEVMEADGKKALSATVTYPTFLDDFERSGVMGVLTPDGKVVAAILLKGSGEAVRQLKNCALAAAHLDPKDPFLSQR